MKNTSRALFLFAAGLALAGCASAGGGEPLRLAGTGCEAVLRCPDTGCAREVTTNQGPVVEPKTARTYFLDYPCDLRKGEKITLVLSLHGGGSFGNWQRHYFPILDQKDKYRLVIATPNTRGWSAGDDAYLQNITEGLIGELGAENIKAFWLVGHSAGGSKSLDLLTKPYFRQRVDGFVSLSGGRMDHHPRGGGGRAGPAPLAPGQSPPPPRPLPEGDFSNIYTTGELELQMALSADSPWAQRLGCKARVRRPDVVDVKAGYVTASDQSRGPSWGRAARPGRAEVHVYPGCRDSKAYADVVRMDKGHTEGLEPKVTEEIVKLMVSAKGGKIAAAGG